MRHSIHAALLVLVSTLLGSCSQPGGGGVSVPATLPADPAGVLLDGDPAGLAYQALQTMTPTAVLPTEVAGGLMTIRLEALLDVTATVGDVNAALVASGAAIVSMRAGFPVVTLVVPPLADVAEATTLANDLVATGAFALATPCFAPVADTVTMLASGGPWSSDDPGDPLAAWGQADGRPPSGMLFANISHLQPLRMPAAKNAMSLSGMNAGYLPVLVPDDYSSLVPDPRITAQDFIPGPGIASPGEEGNHGFVACGLIAIDPAYTQFDAVHPSPEDDLWLWSLPLGGLTWIERVGQTADLLPAAGNFVLHTGFTYDPFFATRSKTWRIVDAVAWRYFAGQDAPRFVHVSPAGNWGQIGGEGATAPWQSPFSIADAFDFLGDEVPQADTTAYDDIVLAIGGEPVTLDNHRIVGSSNPADYQVSVYSSESADVRVLGESINAPCTQFGYGCDGSAIVETSTATASAQLAGLFSYLWSLAPTRSNDELLEIIDAAWFGGNTAGLVDAYFATLALDPSIVDARVRESLLDVAANLDVPDATGNGLFDHHDLKVFLDAFDAGAGSRYDLNGDGNVGGQSTALFDLDVNSPPNISTVSLAVEGQMMAFTEAGATDLEVLCYYAYSALYDGSTTARTVLLAPCNGVPQAGVFVVNSSRTALAYSGSSHGPVDQMESKDTGSFVGTASSSSTQVEGISTGLSSASTTHNSQFGFDGSGNLISLKAGGSGAANFSLTNAGTWAVLGPDGGSVSLTDLRFQVLGGDAFFKLTLNADGSWTGDETIGEDGYVKLSVHLTDNNGTDYTNYDFQTPTGSLPTTVFFSGLLPGDVLGGDYYLKIQIKTHATFSYQTATPPPLLSATANSTWDFDFSLIP